MVHRSALHSCSQEAACSHRRVSPSPVVRQPVWHGSLLDVDALVSCLFSLYWHVVNCDSTLDWRSCTSGLPDDLQPYQHQM